MFDVVATAGKAEIKIKFRLNFNTGIFVLVSKLTIENLYLIYVLYNIFIGQKQKDIQVPLI